MSASDERIERELARLGTEHAPPQGWEARVLAATVQPRRFRWWLAAIPTIAVAATVLVLLSRPGQPTTRSELALTIESGGAVVRGTSAHVGDLVRAAIHSSTRHRALWIYRNDNELLVACPSGEPCRDAGNGLAADMKLDAPGTYAVVGLTSDSPIAEPTGNLDRDVAQAQQDGAQVSNQQVIVR